MNTSLPSTKAVKAFFVQFRSAYYHAEETALSISLVNPHLEIMGARAWSQILWSIGWRHYQKHESDWSSQNPGIGTTCSMQGHQTTFYISIGAVACKTILIGYGCNCQWLLWFLFCFLYLLSILPSLFMHSFALHTGHLGEAAGLHSGCGGADSWEQWKQGNTQHELHWTNLTPFWDSSQRCCAWYVNVWMFTSTGVYNGNETLCCLGVLKSPVPVKGC